MRRVLIAVWLLACSPTWAADPRFSDYPAGSIYRGPPAPPDLSSREARNFRMRIRVGMAASTNFAGHYNLVLWGCGSDECTTGVAVDRITGSVVFIPQVCSTAEHWSDGIETVQGRVDSRLVVVSGLLDCHERDAVRYFFFDGARFTSIKTAPFPAVAGQGATGEGPPPQADCKTIASGVARLACYDRAAGRP